MSTSLYVGKLDNPSLVDPVAEFVRGNDTKPVSRGLASFFLSKKKAKHAANEKLVTNWFGSEDPIASLNILNLASVVLFLEHTAHLEGLSDSGDAITHSRWTNFPYWIDSIWLPIGGRPKVKVQDVEGTPTFLGSTSGLLADLAEINALSPMKFNSVPPHYEMMRSDPVGFSSQETEAMEEPDVLRWVWLALFDAATLANEHQVPVMSG